MTTENAQAIEKKLDIMIGLLQHLLALELSKTAVSRDEIGRHLHVRKATVSKMLKGVKKEE
jgi:Mn-dependent DtxR family transcriptional regulator